MTTTKRTTEMNPATGQQIREVRFVTWVGLIANIFLSVFKIGAGIIGSSQAIIADGFHSLSDTTTDIALLIGVRYWSAPPDENHPHGHYRIETLVTVFIGITLSLVALGLSYNALTTFRGSPSRESPGMIALIAALVSIISKEALYRWSVKVGKRIRSSAVIANAWHHRSDGFSSIPAAIAVAGSMYLPNWYFLDQLGALVVSGFIFQASWKIAWPAFKELTDSGAKQEICDQIIQISKDTDGVLQIHKCRTRQLGFGLQVDLHVQVDPDLSVHEGHEISEHVAQRLLNNSLNIIDVITHLEPYED